MSSISSRSLRRSALLFLPGLLLVVTLVNAADSCGHELSANDFPGVLVIDVEKTEIGIGSVAPFPGGTGRIVAAAGPLVDGAARLHVEPDAFRIRSFLFPYIFSWETTLAATHSGRGLIELPSSDGPGFVSLDILLRAKNRLGKVWMQTNFTTGKSPPVRIGGEDYDVAGAPLNPRTGYAVLVATGKTSPESHIWFRGDDFYARTEVCMHFKKTNTDN